MKCPKCGADTSVLETRSGEHGTTVRSKVCSVGHRFQTVEVYKECYSSAKQRSREYALVTIKRNREQWDRNLDILKHMLANPTGETAMKMVEKHGVSRSSIYLMVRNATTEGTLQDWPWLGRPLTEKPPKPPRKPKVRTIPQPPPGAPRTVWRSPT